jgi:hypothetical protein
MPPIHRGPWAPAYLKRAVAPVGGPIYNWDFEPPDPTGAIPSGSPVIPTEKVQGGTYDGNGVVSVGAGDGINIFAGGPPGSTQTLDLLAAPGNVGTPDTLIPYNPFGFVGTPLPSFATIPPLGIGDYRTGLTLSFDVAIVAGEEVATVSYKLILDTGLRLVPITFDIQIIPDSGGSPNIAITLFEAFGGLINDNVANAGLIPGDGSWHNVKVSWSSTPPGDPARVQNYKVSVDGIPIVNRTAIPLGTINLEGLCIFASFAIVGFTQEFVIDNSAGALPVTALFDNVKYDAGFTA